MESLYFAGSVGGAPIERLKQSIEDQKTLNKLIFPILIFECLLFDFIVLQVHFYKKSAL